MLAQYECYDNKAKNCDIEINKYCQESFLGHGGNIGLTFLDDGFHDAIAGIEKEHGYNPLAYMGIDIAEKSTIPSVIDISGFCDVGCSMLDEYQ